MSATTGAVLVLSGVNRGYAQGGGRLEILRAADLTIRSGELVALVAPSGAGKSTLLHTAGLLERPDSGEVYVNGRACGRLDDATRTAIRRSEVGFVYQFHHLLPEFSAAENVALPQMIAGLPRKQAMERAEELLAYLKLEGRGHHLPSQLSGGEQQRVAIARAVANAPRLLLADEPTGNLDPKTSLHVFEALAALVRGTGLAAVIATHNHDLAARMDRRITLSEGKVIDVEFGHAAPGAQSV